MYSTSRVNSAFCVVTGLQRKFSALAGATTVQAVNTLSDSLGIGAFVKYTLGTRNPIPWFNIVKNFGYQPVTLLDTEP